MNRFSARRGLLPLGLALIVAIPAAVGISYLGPPPAPHWTEAPPAPSTLKLVPGVLLPEVVRADRASLRDGERVIGIVIAGHFRAYRVAAMSRTTTHVLNDCIAGAPVTVTYCDRTDCSQVFTGQGDEPLDIWTAGYRDGLILRFESTDFLQSSGGSNSTESAGIPTGLSIVAHTRTTWKQWRDAHPATEIYEGTLPVAN